MGFLALKLFVPDTPWNSIATHSFCVLTSRLNGGDSQTAVYCIRINDITNHCSGKNECRRSVTYKYNVYKKLARSS